MKKQNVWRPTKMTDKVVQKLKEAFKIWATTQEACYYANISKTTYYDWLKQNSEFSDEIADSKTYLIFQSKLAIANSIESWNSKTAIWYLERKLKNEFNMNYIEEEKDLTQKDPLRERLLEMKREKDKNNKKKIKFIIKK